MGQIEVLNLLKKHKGHWLTSRQMRGVLDNSSTVCVSLMRLRRHSEIKFKREKCYLYSYKGKQ